MRSRSATDERKEILGDMEEIGYLGIIEELITEIKERIAISEDKEAIASIS